MNLTVDNKEKILINLIKVTISRKIIAAIVYFMIRLTS